MSPGGCAQQNEPSPITRHPWGTASDHSTIVPEIRQHKGHVVLNCWKLGLSRKINMGRDSSEDMRGLFCRFKLAVKYLYIAVKLLL